MHALALLLLAANSADKSLIGTWTGNSPVPQTIAFGKSNTWSMVLVKGKFTDWQRGRFWLKGSRLTLIETKCKRLPGLWQKAPRNDRFAYLFERIDASQFAWTPEVGEAKGDRVVFSRQSRK